MKIGLYKVAAVVLAIAAVLNTAVYAKSTSEILVKFDSVSKTVLILGQSGNLSGSAVNLVVMKKGEIPGESKPESVVIAKTQAAGEYSAEIKLSQNIASGEYVLYVTSRQISAEESFVVPDSIQAAEVLADVNKAASASGVNAALSDNYTALGLSEEEFGGAGSISGIVYALRPSEGYSTADELLSVCRESYASLKLKAGSDQELVLKKYESELGISYAVYHAMTAGEKAALLSALQKQTYGERPFSAMFSEVYILARITAAESWVKMRDAVIENADAIGINISAGSAYAQLKYQDEVFRTLYEKRSAFSGLSGVKSEFNSLVSEFAKKSAGTAGSGGSTSSTVTVSAGNGHAYGSSIPVDVKNHWATAYIQSLMQKGYVSGYDDGTFKPDSPVTRAEFLKLAEALISLPESHTTAFYDVNIGDWFYGCIARFEAAGIAYGNDGYFRPNDYITRQDAAALIYRIMGYAGVQCESSADMFDDEISGYAREAVNAMAAAGILSGNGNGFAPFSDTTRAEAAVMISKVIEYMHSAEGIVAVQSTTTVQDRDTLLDEAIGYLNGLGIDTGFAGDEAVSRAEFVRLALGIAKAELTAGGEPPFSDVKESSEYADEITTAYQLGLLEDEAQFRPDENISGYDALRILVKLLGYEVIAETLGEFPQAYVRTADNIKLTKSVTGVNDAAISGRNTAVLLMRTLTTGIMDISSYASDTAKYVRSDDKTLLTEVWHLEKVEAIVTATPICSITSDKNIAGQGYIMLDGVSYRYTGDTSELTGRKVTAYTDENRSIFIIIEKDNNSLLVYEPTGYMTGRLEYETDGAKKRAATVQSIIAVHNGKVYDGDIDKLIKRDDISKVELVDNNDDARYDIMFVTTSRYVRFSSYDLKTSTIYGSLYGISFSASLDNNSYAFFDKGKSVQPYSMLEGEYWAFSVSDDSEVVTGYKLNDSVRGILRSIDEEYITTDDGEYRIDKSLVRLGIDATPGTDMIFRFTQNGRVFAYESAADESYSYAYVIRAFDDFDSDSLWAKLLMKNGEIRTIEFADRVTVDGTSTQDRKKIKAALFDVGGNIMQRVVRIKVTQDKISGIDTEEEPKELYSSSKPKDNSLELYYYGQSAEYNSPPKAFPQFKVAGCDVIFSVPGTDGGTVYNDEEFKVMSASIFQDGNKYTYAVYDIDDEGCPGAIVVYDHVMDMSGSAIKSALVEKVREVYDEEEGSTVYEVRMWVDGEWKTYQVKDEELLYKETGAMLSAGDVIRFTVDVNDKLDEILIDFDCQLMKGTTAAKNNFGKDRNAVSYNLVSAYKKNGDIIFGSYTKLGSGYDYSLKNLRVYDVSKANIVIFDRETKTVESGDVTDINDYLSAGSNASEFLVRQRYFDCSYILVIYR